MTNERDASADARSVRSLRQSVLLSATLERFGTSEVTRHRVRDLSAGGMRIDQATGLRIGATVLVTVGLLQAVGATVAWIDRGWAGIKFAVDVNPDEARGRAAVAPRTVPASKQPPPAVVPTAGWIEELSSPYRKK